MMYKSFKYLTLICTMVGYSQASEQNIISYFQDENCRVTVRSNKNVLEIKGLDEEISSTIFYNDRFLQVSNPSESLEVIAQYPGGMNQLPRDVEEYQNIYADVIHQKIVHKHNWYQIHDAGYEWAANEQSHYKNTLGFSNGAKLKVQSTTRARENFDNSSLASNPLAAMLFGALNAHIQPQNIEIAHQTSPNNYQIKEISFEPLGGQASNVPINAEFNFPENTHSITTKGAKITFVADPQYIFRPLE